MGVIDANSVSELRDAGIKAFAVAIGVFDGIHIGHMRLIETLKKIACDCNAEPVVLTFHPHPRELLKPSEPLLLLMSREKRLEVLRSLGIRSFLTFPFTREFSELDPEQFLEKCLFCGSYGPSAICVGSAWRFGCHGSGDYQTLMRFAAFKKIRFEAVPELVLDGEKVSSSSIRRAISSGRMDLAAKLLGRRHSIAGRVEHGKGIASSKLLCPTANVSIAHGIPPPNGVYAGTVKLDGKSYPAAISVGIAPTVRHNPGSKPLIEAHILDFDREIYGKEIEIEFHGHVREERIFSSLEALAAQIRQDLEKVREILKKENSFRRGRQ